MKLLHVVGARPNFMKIAPVWQAVNENSRFSQILVHTGQHYDVNMSDVFFTDLGLPAPNHYLGIGSGTHAQQTAAVMIAFEKVVLDSKPDMVLVYGDVNSTVAASLVCTKLLIPIAHVEAGLRSWDREMPEEINRILTDQMADLLFTPSPDGDENLLREGVQAEKIHQVGNIMIDSLVRLLPVSEKSKILSHLNLKKKEYAALTLHRPSNVDDDAILTRLLFSLAKLSQEIPIIFPVHPRTRNRISGLNLKLPENHLRLVDPMGYLDFLRLMSQARIVLTDSGGIQEETSYLNIPCLTLRENTERPITIKMGTNQLVGTDTDLLTSRFLNILKQANDERIECKIPLWDGKTAVRIVDVLNKWFDF